jgi:hypothetical protein
MKELGIVTLLGVLASWKRSRSNESRRRAYAITSK